MEVIDAGKDANGKDICNFAMTEEEYQEFDSDYMGLCIHCGSEAFECEPDARNYPCDECSEKTVFGIQELLMMGNIRIVEEG